MDKLTNFFKSKLSVMKKARILFGVVLVAIAFSFYLLSGTGSVLAAPGPGTTDYVRPLAEYQKNGETHYCCKNTQYTSCSSSQLCSDVTHN